MSGPGRRFDPAEFQDPATAPLDEREAAALRDLGRVLETFASSDTVDPTTGFEDRVMAAIALESVPRPRGVRGFLAALGLALRDAWRVAWSPERPLAARAQAAALLLLVVVALGSIGTVTTVGITRLLEGPQPPTTIEPNPAPSIMPGPTTTTPSLTPSPTPTTLPTPSETPETSEEPSETPEVDDGSGGGAGGGTGTEAPTGQPTTQQPSATDGSDDGADGTDHPSETARPDRTPDPSETPEPTATQHPTDTPHPSSTPRPTASPAG